MPRTTSSSNLNRQARQFFIDKWLLILLLSFLVISVTTIYLAQPIMPNYLRSQDLHLKQLFWYFVSFALLFILLKFGTDRLFSGIRIFYWFLMGCLVVLMIDRYLLNLPNFLIAPINGTTAWFTIPKIGSFQPSEFMKVVLIIETGILIFKHNESKDDLSYKSDLVLFAKILKLALPPLILIFLQPDSGIPLIIIFSIAMMLAIGGIRKEWVIGGAIFVVVIFAIIIYLFFNDPQLLGKLLGDNYKLTRFYAWLDSESYILTYGNQLYTSLLTLGSSGVGGHELNQVLVSFPEAHTDFIFTVFGQNFGFIGSTVLISLITAFDLRLIYIALNFENKQEKIVVAGLVGMLIFQQIQNIGMVIGLLPITGITLPFISYGGSSMLSYFIPLAIVFYMYSENKHKTLH